MMDLYQLKGFVSSLAVITTILQFLSGVLVCKQYVANRSTAETSPLPFMCGVLSCGIWLMYGITKHDDIIVLVNIIGVTLMSAYTAVFYVFTFKKMAVLKQAFSVIALLVFVGAYTANEDDKKLLLDRLGCLHKETGFWDRQNLYRSVPIGAGLLACCLTLVTVAAPMSKLLYVLKVKSTECLPFPMILMSFFVSSLWLMYGVIQDDSYLEIPNFLGAILALSQLSLFLVYPRRSQPSSFTKPLMA